MLRYCEPVRQVHDGTLRICLRVDLRQPSILTGLSGYRPYPPVRHVKKLAFPPAFDIFDFRSRTSWGRWHGTGFCGRWGSRLVQHPAIDAGGAIGAMTLGGEDHEFIGAVHERVDGLVGAGQQVVETSPFVVSDRHPQVHGPGVQLGQ